MIRMAETNVLSYVLADPSDASSYASALLSCLRTIKSSTEVTHYVLTKILEVLASVDFLPNPSMLFYDAEDGGFVNNYEPFKHCLSHRDLWIQKASGVIGEDRRSNGRAGGAKRQLELYLTTFPPASQPPRSFTSLAPPPVSTILVSSMSHSSSPSTLTHLISHVLGTLQNSSVHTLPSVVPTLGVLVKNVVAREELGKNGGVGYIARHARASKGDANASKIGAQTLYELGFCLWTMTYEVKLRGEFQSSNVVPVLCELAKGAQREKVVRVAVAALVNLATDHGEGGEGGVDGKVFVEDMISQGLLKITVNMINRQWSDPDIVADVQFLNRILKDNYKDFSTWDKYQAEVRGGRMEWGVTHTEKFWRENHRNMEEGDYQVRAIGGG